MTENHTQETGPSMDDLNVAMQTIGQFILGAQTDITSLEMILSAVVQKLADGEVIVDPEDVLAIQGSFVEIQVDEGHFRVLVHEQAPATPAEEIEDE